MRFVFRPAWGLLLAGLAACTTPPDTRETATVPPPADVLDTAGLPTGQVGVDTTALPRRRPPEPGLVADPTRGTDTLGPRAAAHERIGLRMVQGLSGGPDTGLDTLSPRLLRVTGAASGRLLLCRATATDSVWLDLTPELTRFGEAEDHPELAVREAELDGRGQPELLVTLTTSGYGSGVGHRQTTAWLFDVTPPRPRLLLRVRTAQVEEAVLGYYARHQLPFDPQDQYTGFERSATLRRGALQLGPLQLLGRFHRRDLAFPPLPAGRYRYQGGRLRRVGR